MAILYLDADDEITSAAARIRAAGAGEVALVLQQGSRIATSRINFKLLAREAEHAGVALSIITGDSAARSIAAAAGLPVHATVGAYEEANAEAGARAASRLAAAAETAGSIRRVRDANAGIRDHAETPRGSRADGSGGWEDSGGSRRAGGAGAGSRRNEELTRTMPGGRSALGSRTGVADGGYISVAPRRIRNWRRPAGVAAVVVALAGGGFVGYNVLPSATVTLAVRTAPVGPVKFDVRAAAGVTEPDSVTASIPAEEIPLSLQATATFKASGKRVEEATASGTVQWNNCDYLRSYQVPKGSVVKTASGVAFTTVDDVLLPNATTSVLDNGQLAINCAFRNGDVVAVKAGKSGNVPKGAIKVIPPSLDARAIGVKNASPTTGGTHNEFPRIEQKDVDQALETLAAQLDEQLAATAADPPGLSDGAIPFVGTALREEAVPTVDTSTLVGQEVESFDLGVTARGTVLAVDPSPAEGIGVARVGGKVPAGYDLLAGSEKVTVAGGVVDGQEVRFTVTATAAAVPRIDEAKVRQLVHGATPEAAKAALGSIGDAEITVWPDWVRSITSLDLRLDVKVTGLPTGGVATPTGADAGATTTP